MTRESLDGVFCPRCGSPTERLDGGLTCAATRTVFSEWVESELHRYVETTTTDVPAAHIKWGGGWFCPADATVMEEAHGRVSCPACARTMTGRLLYNVIEFHDHPTSSP